VLDHLRGAEAIKDVPVIIMTAKELDNEEKEILSEHAALIAQKGLFTRDELLGEVKSMLRLS
jgi:CheY-like chemotaxis protein